MGIEIILLHLDFSDWIYLDSETLSHLELSAYKMFM
jgi:hypothetical protein